MTIKSARAIAVECGFTLRKTIHGEYRISKKSDQLLGGRVAEERAYYTDSLDDAMDTIRPTIDLINQ